MLLQINDSQLGKHTAVEEKNGVVKREGVDERHGFYLFGLL
jgi:hypothetical protein